MIPIRDSTQSHSFPTVTVSLIVLNALVFLREITLPEQALNKFFYAYGFIPGMLSGAIGPATEIAQVNIGAVPSLFSAMFMHGGFMHIAGNMLFLWIFGDNVEDRMGKVPFLIFYLAAGIAAGMTHYVIDPASAVPTIGASGAIAGVMGAYIYLFPRGRVTTLLILGIFIQMIELPAYVVLGLWFGFQVLSGTASLAGPDASGIAWFAHIGGFVVGLGAAVLLGRRHYRY